mgnify:CR=1 FL=1
MIIQSMSKREQPSTYKYALTFGDTLLASKGDHLKCILIQQDFP